MHWYQSYFPLMLNFCAKYLKLFPFDVEICEAALLNKYWNYSILIFRQCHFYLYALEYSYRLVSVNFVIRRKSLDSLPMTLKSSAFSIFFPWLKYRYDNIYIFLLFSEIGNFKFDRGQFVRCQEVSTWVLVIVNKASTVTVGMCVVF